MSHGEDNMTSRHNSQPAEGVQLDGYEPPRVTSLGSVTDLTQGGPALGGDVSGPGGSQGGSTP